MPFRVLILPIPTIPKDLCFLLRASRGIDGVREGQETVLRQSGESCLIEYCLIDT